MYLESLTVDPPGWYEAELPVLPVSGTLAPELPDRPQVTLHFDVREGYPEQPGSFSAHASCTEGGRDAGSVLGAWLGERLSELSGSETPLTELATSLSDLPPLPLADSPEVLAESSPAVAPRPAPVEFTAPLPAGHSGLTENQVDRQW